MWLNGLTQWEDHKIGKTHKKNVKKRGANKGISSSTPTSMDVDSAARKITGNKIAMKVAFTYKDGTTPYICTPCNTWVLDHQWAKHARTSSHTRKACQWAQCPPDTTGNQAIRRHLLTPTLVILINSFLTPQASPGIPTSVTEGGPVTYPLMNKKHATRFRENKAAFDRYTARSRVPRWYALLYNGYATIKDDRCEYPFTLFPYLHRDLEQVGSYPLSNEDGEQINEATDNSNSNPCSTTVAPCTLA